MTSHINLAISEDSDLDDADSIPASSNPSSTNSPRITPSGSRIGSPSRSLNGSINNLNDISLPSQSAANPSITPNSNQTPLKKNQKVSTSSALPLDVSNDLCYEHLDYDTLRTSNVVPGDESKIINVVANMRAMSSSTPKKNSGGKTTANGEIPEVSGDQVTSFSVPVVPQETDKDETNYCGRVKLGFFACKKRTGGDYKKAKAEGKHCSGVLKRKMKGCCGWKWWKGYLMDRFPFTKWITKYRLKHLRGDIAAGLTTGFSIIPQGLAYGQIVEVAAQHGLYASVMGSYAYAILGTGRHVAVGPSAILSIVSAEYATGRSPVEHDITYAAVLAFFTGFILIAMGLLRLGILFTFISLPVWKAFRAAAGVTIFASRIKKWWGLLGVPRQFIPQLVETLRRMKETNLLDLLFGSMFVILLIFFKKLKAHKLKQRFREMNWKRKIIKKLLWFLGAERNILIVMIGCAIVYALLQKGWNISHTSDIPRGVPYPAIPAFSLKVNENTTVGLSQIVQDIGVGFFFTPMLAMYETLNVGNIYGRKTNYRVDYNQELIAIGVSNVLSSLVKGHPICGAYLRSGINFGAQVRTTFGGIIAASVLIILTYVAHHLFYLIPVSAMAATIMMGAVDVCTFNKFGFLWTINKIELISWLTTFISSLVVGIEYGVLVGVLTDWLLYLKITRSSNYMKTEIIENEKAYLVLSPTNRVGLSAPSIHDISLRIEDEIFNSGITVDKVYINLQNIKNIDSTAINWLIYLQVKCKKLKKEFKIINTQENVLAMIQKSDARISIQEKSNC